MEENQEPPEEFAFTSHYIDEELGLIQVERENLVSVASELDEAINRSEGIKKLIRIMQDADKLLLKRLDEKNKAEASTKTLMQEIRTLLASQRLEDLDRLMRSIHKQSQSKIHLSQNQLNDLRLIMAQLNQFYQEAAGLCRLSQIVYDRLAKVYEDCQSELEKELSEEEELSKAGSHGGGAQVGEEQTINRMNASEVQVQNIYR
ncbi:hypothetical protein JW826_05795 [Candidatus Woesearchaeota archaeon]|nr:hypothetical protein [Candidatus Woesearchaeota archaeon]